MMILAHAAGPQRMGRVMSVIGVPMLIAPVIGPVLGGYLIDEISWRWIFFVNVPVGIVALVLAQRILDRDRPQERHPLDVRGFLTSRPASRSRLRPGRGRQRGLDDRHPVAAVDRRRRRADRRLRLARAAHRAAAARPAAVPHSGFWASSATTFVLGGALFGAMILIPLYYQLVHGASALEAGLLIAPQGLGVAIGMPIAGRLADRFGPGPDRRPGPRRGAARHVRLHAGHRHDVASRARRLAVHPRRRSRHDDDARHERRLPGARPGRRAARHDDAEHPEPRRRRARHRHPRGHAAGPDRGQPGRSRAGRRVQRSRRRPGAHRRAASA